MHFLSVAGLWASSLAHVALADKVITLPNIETGLSPGALLFANSMLERPHGAPPLFNHTRLRLDVPVVTTTAELSALQSEYGDHTRVEEVDGKAIVVFHNDTSHIATVEGQALADLQRSCDHADEDGDGDDDDEEDGKKGRRKSRLSKRTRCSKQWCLTRTNCSMNRCSACVVLWCV
ncbi:hypothetical protein SLS62_004140 [Diatrype stigma]|uniref:Uncharacterized protein n=1 Tax=Diatrype stigma TaxID=117547 RepID=A0AAN9UWZ8_9PEZI